MLEFTDGRAGETAKAGGGQDAYGPEADSTRRY